MADGVLALNAGSSTVKFAVFERVRGARPRRTAHGLIERRGAATRLRLFDDGGATLADEAPPDGALDHPDAAVDVIVRRLFAQLALGPIVACSHRIAHGGPDFAEPVRLTAEVMSALERLRPLAPLHQPHNLAMVQAAARLLPEAIQVGCFDTAFFKSLPEVARRIPLPRAWADRGVRRYGFHGLSYDHLVGRLHSLDPQAAGGRVVFAHLGSGASLCATRAGSPVATTMGFSPLDGLVMSTRCGALDPGVPIFLMRQGLDADAIEDLLYRRAGLLAVSELSGDMRTLLASGAPEAEAAVDLFVERLVQQIGAMAASLGGLDGLVFSAGIGEHAPQIRKRVAARLEWLGFRLDDAANQTNCARISAPNSLVSAWVIPANEEAALARGAESLLRPAGGPRP